jgi:hypothetical protein
MASGPKIKIWDYDQGKAVRMNPKMIKEARDDPEKWPGCAEVGLGIIKHLFENHVSRPKVCLICTVIDLFGCRLKSRNAFPARMALVARSALTEVQITSVGVNAQLKLQPLSFGSPRSMPRTPISLGEKLRGRSNENMHST